jgi:hypothetical protein
VGTKSQPDQAILWHGGEALAKGSLADCLRSWDRLPLGPRTQAYIQLNNPVTQKSVLRATDLYRRAAEELAQEEDRVANQFQ